MCPIMCEIILIKLQLRFFSYGVPLHISVIHQTLHQDYKTLILWLIVAYALVLQLLYLLHRITLSIWPLSTLHSYIVFDKYYFLLIIKYRNENIRPPYYHLYLYNSVFTKSLNIFISILIYLRIVISFLLFSILIL